VDDNAFDRLWLPDGMDLSRRALLGAGAGAVSATAGCLDAVPFVGGPDVDLSPVPSGADAVVRIDAGTALTDPGVRTMADVGFGDRGLRTTVDEVFGTNIAPGPTSIDGWEAEVRETYGLNPRAASTVTGFVIAAPDNPDRTALGAIVEADWSPEAVVAGLRSAPFSVTERDTGTLTVYDVRNSPASVGVIEDGRYVAGVYGAVELVSSVVDGGLDPLGGRVRSAFAAADEGPVRFGVRAAPLVEIVVALIPGEVEYVRKQLFAEITSISGSIAVEGDERVLRMRATADSESTAEDLESTVEASLVLARRGRRPEVRTVINAVETSLDGNVLSVTYRAGVEDLETIARAVVDLF